MAHELPTSASRAQSAAQALDRTALRQARIDLAACFRMAARLWLEEGICNHFSALVPGRTDLFLVNPHGWMFREITASSLLVCTFDGDVVEGDGMPEATAFHIHARLHHAMPRAHAAFHTHMACATALSMVEGGPLAWAGQTALKFYGRTAVDESYNVLALDQAEGLGWNIAVARPACCGARPANRRATPCRARTSGHHAATRRPCRLASPSSANAASGCSDRKWRCA